eukprot:CAMPEP_0202868474 /NCGR_PEP_ID=MMETSP1391-20130828/10898_1 /ASSEMBLY_ACC=CAM_ASM_000867 /TAXON_ID=1034604 /ORGANISM="Chlamydomonas leiostraca, Strain SAG 11-49" /LENGTH=112 /DNA_ID=CAMNT_0049548649 /DNA_START=200 /DNA_END=538 /DNA_ORIENTATION=+
MDGLKDFKFGQLDIGMKLTLAAAGTFTACAAIAVPNKREKDMAALELFEKPMNNCTPQEKRIAEFCAGNKRWNDFFQTKLYPITRKLPGAKTPFLNPYRDQEFGGMAQDDDE